jgi:hypothetical protein
MVDRVGLGAVFARGRAPVLFALLVLGGALLLRHDVASPNQSHKSALNPLQVRAAFGHLPMSFEPNRGQSNDQVKFQTRGNGYALYLAKNEAVLAFPADSKGNLDSTKSGSLVEMQLVGGNPDAGISGAEPLPGHSNYFIGNNPSRWRRNIPQFSRVQYRGVYPGVDLAFYGKQNRLEYDFDVAPGSNPRQIELTFKGAKSMTLAENGDLVLALDGRELRFEAPHIYQASSAGTQTIAGSFVLRGNSTAGFEVGEYDRSRTLIIDPVLAFSTYLGGSGDESCSTITGAAFVPHCPAIAVDSASRAYVAGATTSSGGTFGGATAPSLTGGADVFLARLDSNGSALDYVTYLGGSGTEYPAGVGVDSGFNVYVAGTTNSANFPVTASAFQSTAGSVGNHVFVAKLDSSGSAHLYSTYLSGTGIDTASGFAVDILGRAYVIGTTTSSNFPTTGGALQPTAAATNQFFFSKVDPAASGTNSLLYSTYIGGSTPSNGAVMGGAVAVDSIFNVYLAGGTTFTDMPVVNAYQSTLKGAGTSDVWAARLNAPASNTQQYTPLYETYLGGSGNDVAYGVASDGTSTYITGSTSSSDITLPTATTAFQSTNKGGIDAFVAKFGVPVTTGTTQGSVPLSYFTYLGGGSTDTGLAIVADSNQNARVTGFTDSSDFPVAIGPIQGSSGGGRDAFFARILTNTTSTTTNTSSSTFLGGSGTDVGTSLALDSSLNDYVAGETKSGNFPSASPLQPSLSGPSDAFVSKLGPSTSGLSMPAVTPANALPAANAANPAVSPSPTGVGSQVTFTYYIYNTTDPVSGVVFTDTLGANSGTASAAASPGTCASSSNGTIVCSLGTVPTSITTTSGTTTTLNFAAKVTVTVTAATSVLSGSFSLGNSAALSFPGTTLPGISGTATVNDFGVSATPASATVTSGASAVYVVKVTPTGAGFPGSVSFSCGSGLPSGASCSFTNNPVPNMNNGPQSRSMQIATTARVTTPATLFRERKLFYAFWLPISGLAVIGTGISRKRRVLLGIFFAMVVGMVLLQAGCGSSKSNTTTTTGTPAGTYTVTVNATSGSATRTTTVQLTVK